MKLLEPITTQNDTRKMTRKKLLDYLEENQNATVPGLIRKFNLDPANALRQRTGDIFPRNYNELHTFKLISIQTYGKATPVEHYLKAMSLIIRMKEEGLLYITSDCASVMIQK